MNEAPMTIVGLAAQMRQLADLEENPKGRYANALRHYADIFVEVATRAVTRAAADAVNLTNKKWRRQCGDMAKMREALVKSHSFLGMLIREDVLPGTLPPEASDLADEVWDALAAPPRNCDVGTAEEQAERFAAFCRANWTPGRDCSNDCPFKGVPDIGYCQSGWGQLPYEEPAQEGGDHAED